MARAGVPPQRVWCASASTCRRTDAASHSTAAGHAACRARARRLESRAVCACRGRAGPRGSPRPRGSGAQGLSLQFIGQSASAWAPEARALTARLQRPARLFVGLISPHRIYNCIRRSRLIGAGCIACETARRRRRRGGGGGGRRLAAGLDDGAALGLLGHLAGAARCGGEGGEDGAVTRKSRMGQVGQSRKGETSHSLCAETSERNRAVKECAHFLHSRPNNAFKHNGKAIRRSGGRCWGAYASRRTRGRKRIDRWWWLGGGGVPAFSALTSLFHASLPTSSFRASAGSLPRGPHTTRARGQLALKMQSIIQTPCTPRSAEHGGGQGGGAESGAVDGTRLRA
jgi:hypothetical protein